MGGESNEIVRDIIEEHLFKLKKLLDGIFLINELSPKTTDKLLSFGELMSSLIIYEAMKSSGFNVQLKGLITETEPNNFENLYIPGFNRTYDSGRFGTGFNFNLSYLIPIFKKDKIVVQEKEADEYSRLII